MNDKAIISETIEHQIKVLKLLEELGYMWWSNDLKQFLKKSCFVQRMSFYA